MVEGERKFDKTVYQAVIDQAKELTKRGGEPGCVFIFPTDDDDDEEGVRIITNMDNDALLILLRIVMHSMGFATSMGGSTPH